MSVRKTFDAELADLSSSLIRMGSEAAGAIDNAIRAFDGHDLQLADAVIQPRESGTTCGKALRSSTPLWRSSTALALLGPRR